MKGRQPLPQRIKILRPTAGHRTKAELAKRGVDREPIGIPDPPEWLVDQAREEWDRIVPLLLQMRLIGAGDRANLASYCEAWRQLCIATKPSAKYAAMNKIRILGFEFGLSPLSRARLSIPIVPEDSLDSFLGEKVS